MREEQLHVVGAEKQPKSIKFYIMVAVIGKEESLIERGKLYVKSSVVCLLPPEEYNRYLYQRCRFPAPFL